MLHDFLSSNRAELVTRCRAKVATRRGSPATDVELEHGIPVFLEQLIRTLRMEQGPAPLRSRNVSGSPGGGGTALSEIGSSAAIHGRELLAHGFSVDQVVHDYGDLCQAITELAGELGLPIDAEEFQTLNRCLDNAIAAAVIEFSDARSSLAAIEDSTALNERLGFLAHELRNLTLTATLSVAAMKRGSVGLNGATGAVLDRSLVGLRNLIDRSLTDVRVATGAPPQRAVIPVAQLIAEVRVSASLEAQSRGRELIVSEVDPDLAVDADRQMLLSALGNLLQNAFKFTKRQTTVSLRAYASARRILIDVEDEGGGLAPGQAEKLFTPFTQLGADRSGLGLGLAISRRSIEANGGALSVRSIPGKGCIFTVDLPRCPPAGTRSAAQGDAAFSPAAAQQPSLTAHATGSGT
jgi:signal transduction histidine kinase